MLRLLLATGLLATGSWAAPVVPAASPAARFASLGLPAALSKARIQALLQGFVNLGYGRSFRHLGDERDFDHGHLLLDAATKAPLAILYHTQEMAQEAATPDYGYVDPGARNWIQWLDGRVENATAYERSSYPRSGLWDWFVARELPKLRARHTITDKMLDPVRLGARAELAPSLQWTFTRVDCGASASDDASNVIQVALPGAKAPVCLSLASS